VEVSFYYRYFYNIVLQEVILVLILNQDFVAVIADWDADGAVSAAIITYTQIHDGFPLEGKRTIIYYPTGAREVAHFNKKYEGCAGAFVILDIPLTSELEALLNKVFNECKDSKVVYVDHHPITFEKVGNLMDKFYVIGMNMRKPTSYQLVEILEKRGLKIPQKLKLYAEAVRIIELGKRPGEDLAKIVELVASISRALKLEHKPEFWEKMVKWMSNPLPIPLSKDDLEILERVKKEVAEKDKEIEKAAVDLAITAEKVGVFKFIDARKKWKRRGVTSLVTRISRNLRAPVALLANLGNSSILVIKTRNNSAMIIGNSLVEEGLAIDVGGHGMIAVVKLKNDFDLKKLKEVLIRYSKLAD
jgi:single-stranded DNA-specific DHH superfamily exonuclease